jgi:hypothetical protein
MHSSATEKYYKRFGQWAMAGVNSLLSCIKIIVKSRRTATLNAPDSAICYVLGNGPSMKDSLRKHKDQFIQGDVMCVNSFALSDEFALFKPKHYVIIDSGLWFDGNANAHLTFEAMVNKCDWEMRLYLPFAAAQSAVVQKLLERNKKVEVYWMNYVVYKGWPKMGYFLYQRRLAMPQSQNVMVAALFWAVHVGYKKIALYGADHNWHTQLAVDENNVVCTRHEHFYSQSGQVQLVPFYKLASTKETFRMDEIFHAWAKVFAGYRHIQAYAKSKSCEIINASEISFVDAFPREKKL